MAFQQDQPMLPVYIQTQGCHLLAHSSGLGNFAIKDDAVWGVDEVSQARILDEIRSQGTAFEPGTRVAYSNSTYLLLRMILEQRYGADFQHIVEQQIAESLGLQHSPEHRRPDDAGCRRRLGKRTGRVPVRRAALPGPRWRRTGLPFAGHLQPR
ncbi:TPA: serine hydrolase [Stenotrophomonas maltophilia]